MSLESKRRQRLIGFIFINTIQYPCALMKTMYYSKKWEPPTFFNSDTNPVLGHVLAHSVDKTHVLVVAVELIWLFLNIHPFNFVPIPNKSLRFTRLRRSYVNCPAVVLINHCQSYTAFLQNNASS